MEWWKKSVSSNKDIRGEWDERFPSNISITEEIIYLTSINDKHTMLSIEFLRKEIPDLNVNIIDIGNPKTIVENLQVLREHHDKIVVGQWYLQETNDELDTLFEELSKTNNLVFLFSAGNHNIPTETLSPLRSNGVTTIGSYNRSGEISSFCNQVNCDYYFPGTSIHIGKEKKKGTSFSVLIACIVFLILRKNNTPIESQITDAHGFRRVILNKTYHRSEYPKLVSFSDVGTIASDGKQLTIIVRDSGNKVVPSMQLIDAIGQELAQNNETITIPMSGGMDSEAIAQACVKHSVPFEAVTMRLMFDGEIRNHHDYKYAITFCKDNNITHRFIDLDCNWFFEEENYLHYVTEYFCESPQIATHLWLLDNYDGFLVFPGDVTRYSDCGLTFPSSQYFSYDYLCHKKKLRAITHMLTHTKQCIVSCAIANAKTELSLSKTHEWKCLFYEFGGFAVDWCRIKQTGFEHLKKQISDKYKEKDTMRKFDNFFRHGNSELFLPEEHRDINAKYSHEYDTIIRAL